MEVVLTLQELMDRYDWGHACDVLGIDPWCINEGTATGDERVQITEEQARKIGISRYDDT